MFLVDARHFVCLHIFTMKIINKGRNCEPFFKYEVRQFHVKFSVIIYLHYLIFISNYNLGGYNYIYVNSYLNKLKNHTSSDRNKENILI